MTAEQKPEHFEGKAPEEKSAKVGKLILAGELNDELFRNTAPALMDLIEDPKNEKIVIILNTGGGNVNTALGFYDLIKGARIPVEILGTGRVMSAGLIILSAGSRRFATSNTRFMFHPGHQYFDKASFLTTEEMEILTKDLKEIDEQVFAVVADRSGKRLEELKMKFTPVKYLSANEAKAENLIDEIVSSPLKLFERE